MRLINKTLIGIQIWFNDLMAKEDGDVNIVSIVVLIGIAVLLAVLFRKNIEKLLNSLFQTIFNNANKAVSG